MAPDSIDADQRAAVKAVAGRLGLIPAVQARDRVRSRGVKSSNPRCMSCPFAWKHFFCWRQSEPGMPWCRLGESLSKYGRTAAKSTNVWSPT